MGCASSEIGRARGNFMLTFRRRLLAPAAAPDRGAGFARLRVATAVDMLTGVLPRLRGTHMAATPRPHGKTRSPDRFLRSGGPRLPQPHWTLREVLSLPQSSIGPTSWPRLQELL